MNLDPYSPQSAQGGQHPGGFVCDGNGPSEWVKGNIPPLFKGCFIRCRNLCELLGISKSGLIQPNTSMELIYIFIYI